MNATRLTIAALLITLFAFAFAPDADAKRRGGRGGGGDDRVREQVELETLPPAVQATILENAGDGKIKGIEKETRRGETSYEAEVKRKDGKIMSIEVAPSGKLISVELAAPEDAD
jgi:hypothetical protein